MPGLSRGIDTSIKGYLAIVMLMSVGCLSDDGSSSLPPMHVENGFNSDTLGSINFGIGGGLIYQEAGNWCWAACLQMVGDKLMADIPGASMPEQAVIVQQVFGGVIDRAAHIDHIVNAINNASITYRFPHGQGTRSFRFHAQWFMGLPAVEQFAPWSNDGNKQIILVVPGHAVVVTLVEWKLRNGRRTFEKIHIHDPEIGRGNRSISGEELISTSSRDRAMGVVVVSLIPE